MTRFEKRILLGLALLIIVLSVLEARVPQPTDWSPSYSRHHKKPLGTSLVFERLVDLFPDITEVHQPVGSAQKSNYNDEYHALEMHTPVNRIFINSYFRFEPTVAEELMTNVYMGDHVFIAAENIGGLLGDSLKVEINGSYGAASDTGDVRCVGDQRIAAGVFRYVRGTSGSSFSRYDTLHTRVLAVNGRAEPVLLETAYGSGRFVLCSMPDAFANFNLLKNNNAEFMAGAFSVLPKWPVVWDEYYKVGRGESQTPLRYLLSQQALRWAWYIALSLILLYIAVYARRQQRAIPIVAAPLNATRELVHTIGRLYWQKGDHRDLAQKMIMHFKDDIRKRTYLRTFAYDDATTQHLAAKTGKTTEEITAFLRSIERYEKATRLSETELQQLNNELYEFRQLIR